MLNKNLEIIKGNDQLYTVAFRDNAGLIDISLWTVYFTIKEQKTLSIIVKKEITEHSDPTNGATQISLSNSETDIKKGKYRYLINVKTGAGEIFSLMSGMLEVIEV